MRAVTMFVVACLLTVWFLCWVAAQLILECWYSLRFKLTATKEMAMTDSSGLIAALSERAALYAYGSADSAVCSKAANALATQAEELAKYKQLATTAIDDAVALRAELEAQARVRAKMVPLPDMNKRILFECVGLRGGSDQDYWLLGFEAAERAHNITVEPK